MALGRPAQGVAGIVRLQRGKLTGARQVLAEVALDAHQKMLGIAELVGRSTIAYLRSETKKLRPPAHRPDGTWTGWRAAHPGNWADVTGVLAKGYAHRVTSTGIGDVTLTLTNPTEYAVFLDVRQGFFVLRGVCDPGGPVDKALRLAIQTVAPGWGVVGRGANKPTRRLPQLELPHEEG